MSKKKKKKSWKEKRRRAALKRERALKTERIGIKRKIERRRKGRFRREVFGVLCVISLVLIFYGVWEYTQPPTESPSPEEAPLFTLTDPDFSDFRGRVVVLDFFATWCSPCIEQIPHLAEIHEKYDSSDVIIISIAPSTENEEDLKQFREEHDMSWRVAIDTVGVFDKYDVRYIPTLVIIDQSGNIYYRNEGLTDASTLSSKIDSLLVH